LAAAITKLAHSKQISLDQSLAYFFPELKDRIENSEQITIKNMVMHRSGIPNFLDHPDYPWDDLHKTKAQVLSYALDLPAEFEPGEDYKYSNTNYLLLKDVIDQVLGYSHHKYIKEVILNPLGLENTFGGIEEVEMDDLMSGYHIGWEPDIKENNYASMIATVKDVGIFLRALNDGSLLTKEEQTTYASIYEFEHTGLVPGYQSIARYHKDIDAVVVQFVNTSGGVAWTLHEIFYKKVVKILKEESN
jgi:CubicO group peptidase (beta-lactamase class C family)